MLMSEFKEDWPLSAYKKATVTPISIPPKACRKAFLITHLWMLTLKQVDYSSRRWHQVPLQSVEKQEIEANICTDSPKLLHKDWKNVVVIIWHKQHESTNPSCFVSTVQVFMVWVYFLGHLQLIENCLKATAWVLLWPVCLWPECSHLLMNASSRIVRHVTKLRLSQTDCSNNGFPVLKWPPQSPDLMTIGHFGNMAERKIHIRDVEPTNLQQLRVL